MDSTYFYLFLLLVPSVSFIQINPNIIKGEKKNKILSYQPVMGKIVYLPSISTFKLKNCSPEILVSVEILNVTNNCHTYIFSIFFTNGFISLKCPFVECLFFYIRFEILIEFFIK